MACITRRACHCCTGVADHRGHVTQEAPISISDSSGQQLASQVGWAGLGYAGRWVSWLVDTLILLPKVGMEYGMVVPLQHPQPPSRKMKTDVTGNRGEGVFGAPWRSLQGRINIESAGLLRCCRHTKPRYCEIELQCPVTPADPLILGPFHPGGNSGCTLKNKS